MGKAPDASSTRPNTQHGKSGRFFKKKTYVQGEGDEDGHGECEEEHEGSALEEGSEAAGSDHSDAGDPAEEDENSMTAQA
eukprot:7648800-Heterocapsa_arctica.AAC.1